MKNRESRGGVKDVDKVYFRGIVKREFYDSLQRILDEDITSLRRNYRPPIFHLISRTSHSNPLVRKSFLPYVREILLASTRNPKLLRSSSWVSFTLIANFPLNHLLDFKPLSNSLLGEKLKIFTSREVARFGFPTNSLSPTLEYELRRSWNSYDLLFVCATAKFHNVKGRLPFSSNSKSQKIRSKLRSIEGLLGNTYFKELLEIELQTEHIDRKEYRGTKVVPIDWRRGATHNSLWVHRTIEQAEILHENVVYSRGQFFFLDRSKAPSYGSVGNVWPGYIYQDSHEVMHSPACRTKTKPLLEAIFLGGIKNWMHFVIEDLPRIIKFDLMGIPNSAPLIISEDLGRQITQSIQTLTNRDLIIAKPFQAIEVTKLHFLEFANPLIATMSGNKEAASQLFESQILDHAKHKFAQVDAKQLTNSNRVLIRREKNLFRPLVNADKLQKILEEEYGFYTLYLGDKNLIEVIADIQNASVLVGEYGAGLANMIFIRNKSLVIEIRGGLEKNAGEYRALGKALGHKYEVVNGVNRKISKFGIARGPYKININKVLQILELHMSINDKDSR